MYTKWLNKLKNVKLFENIELDELNRMLICLKPKIVSYKKKEYITIVENKFTGIGIVIQGEVVVTKENTAGDRVIMTKLKENSIFGEVIAFSNDDKWPVTVIASTDCIVWFFTPNKILANCPKMCIGHKLLIQNMLKIVSQKALELNRKIEYLSMKSIRSKISAYLLEQYSIAGRNKFMVPLKRHELAEFLNVSRPSLSREIIKMKEEGIINFYKSSFEIIDVDSLKSNV
ncbi:Crp/Fnr family transcriptional regulator [Tepidibacter formicigenes]|jgi:CRP-like cAMP-binding protein|uniref:cAMP-binding domain of CRP or a regulatory subunit of cAMP-dependent protein kinases n=1 Tax=Tepidibacter formicigenes DSM 15518 TaxID=1123349 RepID=A0A1M6QFE1_9FIRM|nr:Crp/Fnr family transcriptional regulator [Tepidibacter formicigenes]SHK19024.1 cAMP-binding domain of CRP or a regulatory subunit of cAMP-dependent protein kinases [Tepidibacter formicigenes DSM 15518]